MSNGSYFSHYESPNIVIVPTMSMCNPPSVKRQKMGNNIIVPILTSSEIQESNFTQVKNPEGSRAECHVDKKESSPQHPNLKASWASSYLQNIGLDKISSIWKRKIPRINSSQSLISIETCKELIPDACPSSKCISKSEIENSNEIKISNNVVKETNIFNDKSNTKNKRIIKDNSKHDKQSTCESIKSVSGKNIKDIQNKNVHVNKKTRNDLNDLNIINTDNIKKNALNNQSQNVGTSHKLHKKSETETTKHSSISLKIKSPEKVVKTNNKSVVNRHKKYHDNDKSLVKNNTRQKESNNNSSKSSLRSNITGPYKEKYKTEEHSKTNVKSESTTKSKGMIIENKPKLDKTKSKDKVRNEKSDSKSKKKSMKKKAPETKNYRKIKLVINLICNKRNPLQCNESLTNESHNDSNMSTVPNVDLDFLNDFNIDEIVDSLDTCEKESNIPVPPDRGFNRNKGTLEVGEKNVESNMYPDCNNTPSDAADLINILKGEEDDDLIKLSIENEKALQIINDTQVHNECSLNSHTKYKESNGEKNKTQLTVPLEIKKESVDTSVTMKIAPRIATNDIQQSDNICNATNTVSFKKNVQLILKSDIEDSQLHDSQSISNLQCTLPTEVDDNKNYTKPKHEQKNKPLTINTHRISEFNKPNTDKNKDVKLHCDVTENTNKENVECASIHENNIRSFTHDQKSNEKSKNEDPNKISIKNNGDKETDNQKNYLQLERTNHHFIGNIRKEKSPDKKNLNNNYSEKTNATINNINDPKCGDKEESKAEENYENNKEKGLSDNKKIENARMAIENARMAIENAEVAHGNIKLKVCQETLQKLEKQLITCSGSNYSIKTIIHSGKFSKIFQCKHPNGKFYALKILTTNTNYNLGKEKKTMLQTLIRDIPKNNLFIIYLSNAFAMDDKWCFLMEYYPKNLEQALTEAEKSFSIEQIQDYSRQLVMAVVVLKNNYMVHLDIKPKHILINSTNKILKLCGFDTLCYVDKMKILPNVGTVNYRAPEVILGYQAGFEIDVWSTGLVLYEIAANRKLFPGVYNNDILYKQICTLGCVPYDMLKKSRFGNIHFVGSKFMRKSGFKGQNINIIGKFYKNSKLCDSIYDAYFKNWGHQRSTAQQNIDIGKLNVFVKLLQKMLTVHPEYRLPIEFAYANPFIYDAKTCQECGEQEAQNSGLLCYDSN